MKTQILEQTPATSQTPTVILWGVSVSPYVRKVMVALAEKNIAYEQREILPKAFLLALGKSIPDAFEKASPLGKIPLLQVDNFSISDSAVIAAYLDRKFSTGNKLYPDNPEDYAKSLWFEHYSDTVLTEVAYKKIFVECVAKPKIFNLEPNNNMVETVKQDEIPPLLSFLDKSVQSSAWIAGENFSMADIAIATQLLALIMAGFEISHTKWPHLSRYLAKVTARPSFSNIMAA
jgi:glutathione S-transferase